jgi:phosphomannomutase
MISHNEKIFHEYDIRGLYPETIDEHIAYKIGRAFVLFLRCSEVVIGHDMRASSPKLANAFAKGVTDQGANVINIGLASTPMLYFAGRNKPAAVIITASHNPAQYNGMKLCRENSRIIGGETGIYDIEHIIEHIYKKAAFPDPTKKGTRKEKNIIHEFIQHHLNYAKGISDLKLVFDFANAMGAYEFPLVFDNIPCEKTYLFKELDGTLPHHEANPLKHETLNILAEKVVRQKADIGIATDGDCDRVGFVDEKGMYIPGDIITAVIAEEILKKNPDEKIVFCVKSSRVVKETIVKNNGIPVQWKTGHALIKEKMRAENAIFAGEKSGHYYFRDMFFVESPLLATFIVLKIMCETKKKLSEIVAPFMIYANSGEINFEVKDQDAAIEKIEQLYADARISHLDGVTIEYDDWWCKLRKSNTEPLLRFNLEASTKETVMKHVKKIKNILKSMQQ